MKTNKDIYTEEQVKRVLNGIGVDIESEVGLEYIEILFSLMNCLSKD